MVLTEVSNTLNNTATNDVKDDTIKPKTKSKSLKAPKQEPKKEEPVNDDVPEQTTSSSDLSELDALVTSFGNVTLTRVPTNAKRVYKIVRNLTGSIGGNGAGGAIYGELTIGSMQKVIDIMKKECNFSSESRFIDVGCGLGKPNLHVCQDPGVEFSYGIELVKERWFLGMHNLNHVLRQAVKDADKDEKEQKSGNKNDMTIGHCCWLAHGDITEAKCFNPFTHVYMFDIGFPPTLFKTLAKMFNESQSQYLICYHAPRLMIDRYGFNVELITKEQTSMHGSAEGHMGYFYRRTEAAEVKTAKKDTTPCDPLFKPSWDLIKSGLSNLADKVGEISDEQMESGRPRRSRKPRKMFSPSKNNSVLSSPR